MALIEVEVLGKLEATDVATTSETLLKGRLADEVKLKRVVAGAKAPLPYRTPEDVKMAPQKPSFFQRLGGGFLKNINLLVITVIAGVVVASIVAWLKISA